MYGLCYVDYYIIVVLIIIILFHSSPFMSAGKYRGVMAKSHKAMSDGEWLARLQKFASSGVWPSGEGNRPAPRQKRWHELYLKVNAKCSF